MAGKTTVQLTDVERDHLLILLDWNMTEGTYWGNQEQYQKRAQRLVEKLGGIPK